MRIAESLPSPKTAKFGKDYWTEHTTYQIPTTLKKVNVTNALALPYGAFQGMTTLEEINLNEDLVSISKHSFKNCQSLKTLSLPSIQEIPGSCFNECWNLESITVNEDITKIGDYAFENCMRLSKFNSNETGHFNIPSKVSEIGWAFGGVPLMTHLRTPFIGGAKNGAQSKANMGYIFGRVEYAGTTKVTQHYSNDPLDDWDWYVPSRLKEIEVYDALSVGLCAFENMTMLESVRINESAKTSIGDNAFRNCVEPTWF